MARHRGVLEDMLVPKTVRPYHTMTWMQLAMGVLEDLHTAGMTTRPDYSECSPRDTPRLRKSAPTHSDVQHTTQHHRTPGLHHPAPSPACPNTPAPHTARDIQQPSPDDQQTQHRHHPVGPHAAQGQHKAQHQEHQLGDGRPTQQHTFTRPDRQEHEDQRLEHPGRDEGLANHLISADSEQQTNQQGGRHAQEAYH